MKEQEVIEGNKLIAEFMGFETIIHDGKLCRKRHWTNESTEYHSSWDWLMPVVEKIENSLKLKYEVEIGNNLYAVNENLYRCIIHDAGNAFHLELESNSKAESVWLAVTKFIQWYNQQYEQKR